MLKYLFLPIFPSCGILTAISAPHSPVGTTAGSCRCAPCSHRSIPSARCFSRLSRLGIAKKEYHLSKRKRRIFIMPMQKSRDFYLHLPQCENSVSEGRNKTCYARCSLFFAR